MRVSPKRVYATQRGEPLPVRSGPVAPSGSSRSRGIGLPQFPGRASGGRHMLGPLEERAR